MDVAIYNEEVEYNALLREYAGCVLNEDQLGFVRAISEFLNDDSKRVFILQGCAGSGKTFLMQGVAKYLFSNKRQVRLPKYCLRKVVMRRLPFINIFISLKSWKK